MKDKLFIGIHILLIVSVISGCGGKAITYDSAFQARERGDIQRALGLYTKLLDDSKYAGKAHFQMAKIYKSQGKWSDAMTHYQAILDATPTGYLASEAKKELASIRDNTKIIEENRRIYLNNDRTESGNQRAGLALLEIAKAYQNLEVYDKAIETYRQMVNEFPKHPQAAQAQFAIGNIYFYKLYDYKRGWPEFVAVKKQFPASYEAVAAHKLLLKADKALKEINQEIEYIKRHTNPYGRGNKRIPSWGAIKEGFEEQVAQAYLNIANLWRTELKNYPNAIAAYKELVTVLPSQYYIASDAVYQTAKLYQDMGEYEQAIAMYDKLFEGYPQSFRRDESVYNQALCYETIQEYDEAYKMYKAYLSLGKETEFYRAAEHKVRQFEVDADGDGFMFYQERKAGTSDIDPNLHPEI